MPDARPGRLVAPSTPSAGKRSARDKTLLDELRRVAGLVDQTLTLTKKRFDAHAHPTLTSERYRRYGSWRRALARAGLADRYSGFPVTRWMRTKPGRALSDAALLDRLRQVARRDGVVTIKALARRFGISVYPLKRRFGSWAEAVRRAGLRQSSYARDPAMLSALCGRRSANMDGRAKRAEDIRFIPVGLRFKILQRDAFRCTLCGNSPALTRGCLLEIDHTHPWSKGGKTEEANLRTLCRDCNRGKAGRVEREPGAAPAGGEVGGRVRYEG